MSYLIGIDLSTTAATTLVLHENGTVISSASEEYPLLTPHHNWAEQNPDDWWAATKKSIQRALAHTAIDRREIKAIGLTGQMHGLVLMDKTGRVLRPAILWNDQRTDEECKWITEQMGFSRLVECVANPALCGFTAPKILWVKRHEPQVYEKIAHVLLPKDYIRYCLTGVYATDVSDASGMLLLDVRKRTWSQEMLTLLGIAREWLPTCFESTEITGHITHAIARETGLPSGIPVVAGAGDQAAHAVGSGIVRQGLVSATIGTSGVVFAHTDTLTIDPQARLHAFCHAVPHTWHQMGVMLSAGGSLRWFRDTFCAEEKIRAAQQGCDVYDIVIGQTYAIPVGSEGLLFMPYLTGERTPYPDPDARGAFIGLTIRHTKAHCIRAVLEGVAFGLRDSLELIKNMGQRITEVRVSGGGARSDIWRHILADVFGTEIVMTTITEGAAYGAALLAGVGTHVYASLPDACDHTIHVTQRITPNEKNAQKYQSLYAVYQSLYPTMKPVFEKLL